MFKLRVTRIRTGVLGVLGNFILGVVKKTSSVEFVFGPVQNENDLVVIELTSGFGVSRSCDVISFIEIIVVRNRRIFVRPLIFSWSARTASERRINLEGSRSN